MPWNEIDSHELRLFRQPASLHSDSRNWALFPSEVFAAKAASNLRILGQALRIKTRERLGRADMGFLAESSLGNYINLAPVVSGHFGHSPVSEPTPVVSVVDGDKAVRESLERLISCEGWFPKTFASAEEFLAQPREHVPSCLIFDVSVPGSGGLELQKRLATERPDISIIFLSATSDVSTTVKAMKAGAVEFFTKPIRSDALLSAVQEALEQSRLAQAHEADKRALRNCYASLSCRERQVMTLAASGLLNKQVGYELGISEITVKAHRGQVMQKMQASSFADLVKMAAKLGIAAA
jgi:FixJ family two-component response regulator